MRVWWRSQPPGAGPAAPTEAGRGLGCALAALDDAFVSIDPQGRITAWNARAERLFGWSASEVLGRSLAETVIPPELAGAHAAGFVRHRPGDPSTVVGRRVELPAMRRDGSRVPIELTVWAHGDGTGYSALLHDVSDRVRDRAELEAARDAARGSSRHKSMFLANMSHEIRTPMNGVIGMATLLLDGDLDDRQRAFATTLLTSAEALLEVLDGVLDTSRVEAGRIGTEDVDLDPAALLTGAVQLMAAGAVHRGLTLTCEIDPAVPAVVRGDPAGLRQVFVNLVGNAVKFTRAGSVTVTAGVDAGDVGTGGPLLRVDVADTGIGIDPHAVEHMFDPFAQADTSTTRQYGGTGLGLTISRQLVELMGGSLTARSVLGSGSVFTVLLPLRACAATPVVPPAGAAPARAPRAPRAGGAGRRLLLAEDNEVNQLVAVHLLTAMGYAVDVVADGEQAVRAYLSDDADDPVGGHDAILMDCQMPVLDGYDATGRIRAAEADRPGARRVPIVALTAGASQADRLRCLRAGMDEHVAKPIDRARLAAVLATVLDGAPAAGPSPRPAHTVADGVTARLADLFDPDDPDDRQMRDQLLTSFAERAPGHLQALRTGLAAADPDATARAAHSLKGMAGNLGADALAERCERLEHLAAGGSLEGADELLREVHAEVDSAVRALEDLHGVTARRNA